MSASAQPAPTHPKPAGKKQHGLAFWMQRVLEECDRAGTHFAPDPVHDLRVALRRCRSMADGLMAMDPDPSWKQMKRAGKPLFSKLGELRDVQVMQEWVNKLGSADDFVTGTMLRFLAHREAQHKQEAAQALQDFDRKQWTKWSTSLPRRAARIRTGSLIFKHLALERWTEAYALHKRAVRSRSQVAWHSLRIGLKRFRYIVENFLPEQHESWINDLKELQDMLGEIHDVDVLWNTALEIKAFPDANDQHRWHTKILEERNSRIDRYREKMLGKTSLWRVWRAQLPAREQIESAVLNRLKVWASFLDPDFKHSRHVARLALQLYDGMSADAHGDHEREKERSILEVAALLRDVGLSKKKKGHQKASYRMIEKLRPPLGWTEERMHLTAAVSRYHCGALPRPGQKALAQISPAHRHLTLKLAGILRLANAFDADHSGRIHRLDAATRDGRVVIAAQGYNPRDGMAESIAAARHLLETVSRRPIVVKAMRTAPRSRVRTQLSSR
jgi:CHAD domain-containing protein/HD superfamily phosphodiesterase